MSEFLFHYKIPNHHLTLSAQYAAEHLPFAIFFACLALKDLRLAFSDALEGFLPAPFTPCCPKRMVLTLPSHLATTTWFFVGWLGVLLGLL